jgi:UDPglucose 6-dehydrogenase
MSQIVVIGMGYVGITTLAGLASLGHTVLGLDVDSDRVDSLNAGVLPIFENGLESALRSQLGKKQVSFTSSYEDVPKESEFIFICVPTPSSQSGKADLTFLESAIGQISNTVNPAAIVIIKSTVPIGTCSRLADQLEAKGMFLTSNPEFLAEGRALSDFLAPSRIVIGAKRAEEADAVLELFSSIDAPKVSCSLESAESIKHGSNSFLAVKLSFINELAALCEKTGANWDEVSLGMGLDSRIGQKFMNPGPGWGGSCFPKDSAELALKSREFGTPMLTLEAAILSNSRVLTRVLDALMELVGGSFVGKRLAVWGIAFKANTDDWRDSPALSVIQAALAQGAQVNAFDPMTLGPKVKGFSNADSALAACVDADALVVLTEWQEFSEISPVEAFRLMKSNAGVLDTRRVLDAETWQKQFPKFKRVGQK